MDLKKRTLKGGASTLLMSLVVLYSMTLAMTLPVPTAGKKGHLTMWMVTKKLIPRMDEMARIANEMLNYACIQENSTLTPDECRRFADSLPTIDGMGAVPSPDTLKMEQNKKFVQLLVLNAFESLKELQNLLKVHMFSAPCKDESPCVCRKLQHFNRTLGIAADEYNYLVTTFYQSEKPVAEPKEVEVRRTQFGTDEQVVIKVLQIGTERFNEIKSVLEYSVEFSWFSNMDGKKKQCKGKKRKCPKKPKTKKPKKGENQ